MKLFIKILGVIALLASVQAGHAQERDTIVVHDTIYIEKPKKKADIVESTDLVRLKPFGRYDRGIVNYKFLPKGKWVGGLTFSYITFDSKESSILYSLLGNINANFAVKAINPYIGYSLKDNMVIGAKFGYNHLLGDLGNIDLDLGSDMSFSIGDMRYTEDLYSFGVFHRSYVGLDAGGIFGLFNETSLTYKHGTSSYSTDRESNAPKHTETTINELHLGINAGIAVYITPNVCAEMSFGVAGFKYRNEKQQNELGEEGSRSTSGANFKINILNINIGITLCL